MPEQKPKLFCRFPVCLLHSFAISVAASSSNLGAPTTCPFCPYISDVQSLENSQWAAAV